MDLWLAAVIIVLLALAIDAIIGELPNCVHPLRWIGNTVSFLDKRIKRKGKLSTRTKGAISFFLVVLIFGSISLFVSGVVRIYLGEIAWIIVSAFFFKTGFAIFSFRRHCIPIQKDLKNNDLIEASKKTQMIVSRKTEGMDAEHLASCCTETISENYSDSVVSPTFFFGLFGLPGIIFFRCANLMDAMWGYLNEKYSNLGFFVAKTDDVLGFVTSRISIIFITIAAMILRLNWKAVIPAAIAGKNLTPSPNSSWSMCACAAALNIKMEKKGVYIMGDGSLPTVEDISRCYRLVEIASIIFLILVSLPLFVFLGIHVQIFIENLLTGWLL